MAQESEPINVVYPQLEASLRPMMRQLAHQFAPSLGVEFDDALQEVRMSVFQAFQAYDYNRGGGRIRSFARKTIKNALCQLAYAAATQARCPHTVYTDDSGRLCVAKHKLASVEDLLESGAAFPNGEDDVEQCVCQNQIASRLRVLHLKLYRILDAQERSVFRLKSNPPESFLLFLRNIGVNLSEATNKHIARFLGVSKNSVDYSSLKIRRAFTQLAELEFSDLVQDLILDGDWPMFHVSDNPDDVDFVRQVIQSRKLDPRPLPERREICIGQDCGRIIEHYHWGVVLHLTLRNYHATVVAEGKFNQNTGDVFGQHGLWKSIVDVVPWYRSLVREITKP
jgi:RNA polymerase sigma factor (sigma-70 family)